MNNMKRMRGRNHRGGGPGGGGGSGGGGGPIRHQGGGIPLNRNHVFDSNGPDLRVRGTAQQLFERYLQLGRDATSSGDRVMAESYFQHAEHYFRILNAMAQAQAAQPPQNGHMQPRRGQGFENGAGDQSGEPSTMGNGSNGYGNDQGGSDDTPPEPMTETRHVPIAAAPPEN